MENEFKSYEEKCEEKSTKINTPENMMNIKENQDEKTESNNTIRKTED